MNVSGLKFWMVCKFKQEIYVGFQAGYLEEELLAQKSLESSIRYLHGNREVWSLIWPKLPSYLDPRQLTQLSLGHSERILHPPALRLKYLKVLNIFKKSVRKIYHLFPLVHLQKLLDYLDILTFQLQVKIPHAYLQHKFEPQMSVLPKEYLPVLVAIFHRKLF